MLKSATAPTSERDCEAHAGGGKQRLSMLQERRLVAIEQGKRRVRIDDCKSSRRLWHVRQYDPQTGSCYSTWCPDFENFRKVKTSGRNARGCSTILFGRNRSLKMPWRNASRNYPPNTDPSRERQRTAEQDAQELRDGSAWPRTRLRHRLYSRYAAWYPGCLRGRSNIQ